MIVLQIVQLLLAVTALSWALYVVAMPIAARLRRRSAPNVSASPELPALAVVIPAHDMESEIEDCLAALLSSDYPGDRFTIHVVADHCTDETPACAGKAGANVLLRNDGPAGKTYAIAWALDALSQRGADPDAYLITDATARVDRGFLRLLASAVQDGEDIVVGHSIASTANTKWFARCLGLTLVHRNLQNWARERLGLSSLIEGRGMAYSRNYVRRFGWSLAVPTQTRAGQHPTEDWRHGVRVVENGLRVAYRDDARVFTPFRESLAAATRQGIRWERGRQLNAVTHGLKLLATSLRDRSRLKFFAALDAIQLPVAVLGVLCGAVAVLTLAAPGGPVLRVLGFAPVALMALYGLMVSIRGRNEGIPSSALFWAPVYLFWRLSAFVLAWTSFDRSRASQQRPNT